MVLQEVQRVALWWDNHYKLQRSLCSARVKTDKVKAALQPFILIY